MSSMSAIGQSTIANSFNHLSLQASQHRPAQAPQASQTNSVSGDGDSDGAGGGNDGDADDGVGVSMGPAGNSVNTYA